LAVFVSTRDRDSNTFHPPSVTCVLDPFGKFTVKDWKTVVTSILKVQWYLTSGHENHIKKVDQMSQQMRKTEVHIVDESPNSRTFLRTSAELKAQSR